MHLSGPGELRTSALPLLGQRGQSTGGRPVRGSKRDKAGNGQSNHLQRTALIGPQGLRLPSSQEPRSWSERCRLEEQKQAHGNTSLVPRQLSSALLELLQTQHESRRKYAQSHSERYTRMRRDTQKTLGSAGDRLDMRRDIYRLPRPTECLT